MQRKSQQIESEIDEAQGKKEKKKTLKMRIPLFSPTSRVKYFLISFFLPFSWFPPKVNHIQQHLSNSNIHFLPLLPSLSQTYITVGRTWSLVHHGKQCLQKTLRLPTMKMFTALPTEELRPLWGKGKQTNKQTGYEEHLFIWTPLVRVWELLIHNRQKSRCSECRWRNETWKVTF